MAGRGVNYTLPYSAEVKERAELYFYSPLGLHDLDRDKFPYFYLISGITKFKIWKWLKYI